ncbi:MAG: aminodeoxychorismate synthase component I [Legionella sp.]|nr:aminodeoxychorismate synthase component I [Legionella sp.]
MHQDSSTLIKEIPYCDPVSLFEGVHHRAWAILLDSALQDTHCGRFSYIAVDPFKVLWAKDGQIKFNNTLITSHINPFDLLKDVLVSMPEPMIPNLPPFQGGAAGTFSYDLYQYLETIPAHCSDDTFFPDMAIGFYDVVISFDHDQKKAWIVSTGLPETLPATRSLRAAARLHYFTDLLKKPVSSSDDNISSKMAGNVVVSQQITSNFNKETYADAVKCLIEYIMAGDIFEANISQCFTCKLPFGLSPFELYKRSRKNNPAPFAAFINLGDIYVVSASPERFLQLIGDQVETRPIKGTRARSADFELDRQLAEELQTSAKDHAENIMIVDLMRNDLSKICEDHSVEVTQLCGLESYATVHHLVSVITGKLKPNHHAVDLLAAAFPGGSITGAPKIRAMQIIATIEPTKRGMYCGSLGFIGFNGSMDTSIVIRSYTIKGDRVTFQVGGAVVADSNPEEEYQETLTKSSALHEALGLVL